MLTLIPNEFVRSTKQRLAELPPPARKWVERQAQWILHRKRFGPHEQVQLDAIIWQSIAHISHPARQTGENASKLLLRVLVLGQTLATLGDDGDDAQLANVDLQSVLQVQQQTLQLLSNVSKMHYDTAMAVIRKIGG
jgi:hypothetical protein